MMECNTRHAGRVTAPRAFLGPIALAVLAAGAANGCIDPGSPLLQQSSEGCDEFVAGKDVAASLAVDAKVKSFMQAATDFSRNAGAIKHDVVTACANIAADLGASDTWSGLADSDDRMSNSKGTGACDAAGSKIEESLIKAGQVNARVAIAVSRGECHLDFDEQRRCDADCAAHATCEPGSVETRCEPGSLSVKCEGSCNAGASCVGTTELPANCMGKCESECTGECKGECIDEHGHATTGNPNCMGKCASSCNGTCRGMCKIEDTAGVSCGASVRCTGGCTGTFTDPVCTSEFTPPKCEVDADCHAACSARVAEDAVCDPTQIRIFADIEADPDIGKVVDTLQRNLPPLFDAANVKGKLVLDAAGRLGDTGKSLEANVENLDGKSLACLGKASAAVGDTIGSIDVSVNASVKVTVKTTDHAE
jgi:hypothetical protein